MPLYSDTRQLQEGSSGLSVRGKKYTAGNAFLRVGRFFSGKDKYGQNQKNKNIDNLQKGIKAVGAVAATVLSGGALGAAFGGGAAGTAGAGIGTVTAMPAGGWAAGSTAVGSGTVLAGGTGTAGAAVSGASTMVSSVMPSALGGTSAAANTTASLAPTGLAPAAVNPTASVVPGASAPATTGTAPTGTGTVLSNAPTTSYSSDSLTATGKSYTRTGDPFKDFATENAHSGTKEEVVKWAKEQGYPATTTTTSAPTTTTPDASNVSSEVIQKYGARWKESTKNVVKSVFEGEDSIAGKFTHGLLNKPADQSFTKYVGQFMSDPKNIQGMSAEGLKMVKSYLKSKGEGEAPASKNVAPTVNYVGASNVVYGRRGTKIPYGRKGIKTGDGDKKVRKVKEKSPKEHAEILGGSEKDIDPDEYAAAAKNILNTIARAESDAAGGYSAVVHSKTGDPDLTGMTIAEARKKYPNIAIGRYQITNNKGEKGEPGTEDQLIKKLGIDPKTFTLTKENQDLLGTTLLERRGFNDYITGALDAKGKLKVDTNKFANNISKEWAGLPKDESGKSYYAGDKWGNEAHIPYPEITDAIEGTTPEIRMLQNKQKDKKLQKMPLQGLPSGLGEPQLGIKSGLANMHGGSGEDKTYKGQGHLDKGKWDAALANTLAAGGKISDDAPSHEQGGVAAMVDGEQVAELEGGEGVFSVKNTKALENAKSDKEIASIVKGQLAVWEKNTSGKGAPGIKTEVGDAPTNYYEAYDYAVEAGVKFPAAVAAQWALESGWGKKTAGTKYNYFGIKYTEAAAQRMRDKGIEVTKGKVVKDKQTGSKDPYMEFASPKDAFIAYQSFIDTNRRYSKAMEADNAADYIQQIWENKIIDGKAYGGYAEKEDYVQTIMDIIPKDIEESTAAMAPNPDYSAVESHKTGIETEAASRLEGEDLKAYERTKDYQETGNRYSDPALQKLDKDLRWVQEGGKTELSSELKKLKRQMDNVKEATQDIDDVSWYHKDLQGKTRQKLSIDATKLRIQPEFKKYFTYDDNGKVIGTSGLNSLYRTKISELAKKEKSWADKIDKRTKGSISDAKDAVGKLLDKGEISDAEYETMMSQIEKYEGNINDYVADKTEKEQTLRVASGGMTFKEYSTKKMTEGRGGQYWRQEYRPAGEYGNKQRKTNKDWTKEDMLASYEAYKEEVTQSIKTQAEGRSGVATHYNRFQDAEANANREFSNIDFGVKFKSDEPVVSDNNYLKDQDIITGGEIIEKEVAVVTKEEARKRAEEVKNIDIEAKGFDDADGEKVEASAALTEKSGGMSDYMSQEDLIAAFKDEEEEIEATGLKGVFDKLGGVDKALELTGMYAAYKSATAPLPQQAKSEAWNRHMDVLKARQNYGMSAEAKTLYQRQAERTYHMQVRQIGQYATSGQAAIGAMGAAALSKYDKDLQMGAMDDQAREQHFREYGSALARDEGMTQQMWTKNVYDEAARNREMKAGLLGQATKNLREDARYKEEYGKGSWYHQLMDSKIEAYENANITSKVARYNALKEAGAVNPKDESAILSFIYGRPITVNTEEFDNVDENGDPVDPVKYQKPDPYSKKIPGMGYGHERSRNVDHRRYGARNRSRGEPLRDDSYDLVTGNEPNYG